MVLNSEFSKHKGNTGNIDNIGNIAPCNIATNITQRDTAPRRNAREPNHAACASRG